MTLTIDGHSSRPYVLAHADNTNTDTPDGVLYLGGVPDDVRAVTKLKSTANYIGCMRNWQVGGVGRRHQHRRREDVRPGTAAIAVIRKVGDVGDNDECPVN